MDINLVSEGLKFMVLGMVTVFLFLILMVIVLKLQSKIILKYFPVQTKTSTSSSVQSQIANDDTTLVAVITAAITQFRKQNTQ